MEIGSKVHLIGIGGSGLSAIARVLVESGYQVSGSDLEVSPMAQGLIDAGVTVHIGHRDTNIGNADVIVRSSAIPDANVEVQAAIAKGKEVFKRTDFLSLLLNGCYVIAIAGTHGKTTTTTMISWVLSELGQNPSFIIGGVSKNLGTNAHASSGKYFVIEADEYDNMFLGLSPSIAVITNVEHDHPDCFPTTEDFHNAFIKFIDKLVLDGMLLVCEDDPGVRHVLNDAQINGRKLLSYGIHTTDVDYKAENISPNKVGGFDFDVLTPGSSGSTRQSFHLSMQVPGHHNVQNTLATMGVIDQLGLSMLDAAQALGNYQGSGRRFEVVAELKGITLISDYAHHPTEIQTTLRSARYVYPDRIIWTVWQPHTYSRTRLFLSEFAKSFTDTDHLVITEIYPAREAPPTDGFSAKDVIDQMAHDNVHFIPGLDDVTDFLLGRLKNGDVLIVLSAGNADQVIDGLEESLPERN
jgi:UDP-N-acetylmuramate--alanine ligase